MSLIPEFMTIQILSLWLIGLGCDSSSFLAISWGCLRRSPADCMLSTLLHMGEGSQADREHHTCPISKNYWEIQTACYTQRLSLTWLKTEVTGENLRSPAAQPTDDDDDDDVLGKQIWPRKDLRASIFYYQGPDDPWNLWLISTQVWFNGKESNL